MYDTVVVGGIVFGLAVETDWHGLDWGLGVLILHNRHYAKYGWCAGFTLFWLWLRWKLSRRPAKTPETMEAFA